MSRVINPLESPNHRQPAWLPVLVSAWAFAIAAGLGSLIAYSQTPGATQHAPWSRSQPPGPWRIIVGVHPGCPCTLATVSELERLLARAGTKLRCVAYAYSPSGDARFVDTLLVRRLGGIPNCRVIADPDGRLMSRHGIATSGGCVLYDESGALRFSGGVTPSRGHEGENLGAQSVSALIRGETPTARDTPVYGCRIVAIQDEAT